MDSHNARTGHNSVISSGNWISVSIVCRVSPPRKKRALALVSFFRHNRFIVEAWAHTHIHCSSHHFRYTWSDLFGIKIRDASNTSMWINILRCIYPSHCVHSRLFATKYKRYTIHITHTYNMSCIDIDTLRRTLPRKRPNRPTAPSAAKRTHKIPKTNQYLYPENGNKVK